MVILYHTNVSDTSESPHRLLLLINLWGWEKSYFTNMHLKNQYISKKYSDLLTIIYLAVITVKERLTTFRVKFQHGFVSCSSQSFVQLAGLNNNLSYYKNACNYLNSSCVTRTCTHTQLSWLLLRSKVSDSSSSRASRSDNEKWSIDP